MSKLIRPRLFSKTFSVAPEKFEKAGLIDPILNCDTKIFIDPLLIATSSHKEIRSTGKKLMDHRFDQIVRLVYASKKVGDKAWTTAENLLALNERPETCLGYGGSGTSGSSRPKEIRRTVIQTTREVVELGEHDPAIISLMGLFDEGVGPDTISDLATNIILPVLTELTSKFCIANSVPVQDFGGVYKKPLPVNPYRKGTPILLVPRDIVRRLPLAADWADVSKVVQEIDEIREAFNRYVGSRAELTMKEKKEALRKAALESAKNFRVLLNSLVDASVPYDPNSDILNYYAFRKLLASDPKIFVAPSPLKIVRSGDGLKDLVEKIVAHFKKMVEDNNLWELLWDGPRPKRERASQLVFFAIADMFCQQNNIDISPETNMGGGPVDFKFSSGYQGRVVVELKLSKGQVVHGYKKQLEVYKNAAATEDAVFVVVNVGKMGRKLKQITDERAYRLQKGQKASEIVVVNALRRASASRI